MSIYAELVNLGIPDTDAQTLDQNFGTDPGALQALEALAGSYFTGDPLPQMQFTDPTWAAIWQDITGAAGGSIKTAIEQAIDNRVPSALWLSFWDAVFKTWQRLKSAQAAKGMGKKKKDVSTAEYIQVLTGLGYSFRMNELADDIEVNGARISDGLRAEIRTKLRDTGYPLVLVAEDAYQAHAHQNRYHPIKEYLAGLAYDGDQHIAMLADHFQDRDGVFALWLRRWLIGAVAKAMDGEQNFMLVLDGKQGIGKSYLARWLCSRLPAHFIEKGIDPTNKDDHIQLVTKWIWEVAELGATTRKADREALKFFITQQTVTIRRPYSRFDLHKPALASFIGTVNNEAGILSDKTGSRRFVVANVTGIDWSYSDLDVDQIWAEAYAAYLAGEDWRLSKDEADLAAQINEGYEIEDPIEGLLLQHFEVGPTIPRWLPTAEILIVLEANGLRGNSRANSMYLASTLRSLGAEKAKRANNTGQKVWGWQGVNYVV